MSFQRIVLGSIKLILSLMLLFPMAGFAYNHIFTITAATPFPASVTVSSTTTATFTVTNTTSHATFTIIDESQFPSSSGLSISSSTCGSLLSPGQTCTINVKLQPTSAQTISTELREWAKPTADGVQYPINVTVTSASASLLIYVTTLTYNGSLGGVTGADSLCQADSQCPAGATCKAMLSDNNTRTASPALNWVLEASTQYTNTSSQVIGTTTNSAIFDFPLTNAINPGGSNSTWTGLNTDWTSNGTDCNHFTSNSGGVSGIPGLTGSTTSASINNVNLVGCATKFSLYCAQQS